MALVIGADLLGEMLDHLAVTDQQQVVVGRQHMGDLGEERAHVLVAMALAGRWLSVGGRPVERCLPGTVDAMRWRRTASPLQRTTEAKSAEIQTPVACGAHIPGGPFQGGRPAPQPKGDPSQMVGLTNG